MNEKTSNLLTLARRAKENNDNASAANYYEQILVEYPNNWEASFYATLCKASQCKIAEIASSATIVKNTVVSTLKLIHEQLQDAKEQEAA